MFTNNAFQLWCQSNKAFQKTQSTFENAMVVTPDMYDGFKVVEASKDGRKWLNMEFAMGNDSYSLTVYGNLPQVITKITAAVKVTVWKEKTYRSNVVICE